jgi:hypothetical protein
MGNPISKFAAFFISIILIVWLPVYESFVKQDSMASQQANQAVTLFVDNVRSMGYITPKMYQDFIDSLEVGSYLYDVEITHQKRVETPVYTDPSDFSTFTGESVTQFKEYYLSQISETLFPDSNKPIDDDSRIYYVYAGDYFNIEVHNKTRAKSSMMRDFLTFGKAGEDEVISIIYGGMVLNEDY